MSQGAVVVRIDLGDPVGCPGMELFALGGQQAGVDRILREIVMKPQGRTVSIEQAGRDECVDGIGGVGLRKGIEEVDLEGSIDDRGESTNPAGSIAEPIESAHHDRFDRVWQIEFERCRSRRPAGGGLGQRTSLNQQPKQLFEVERIAATPLHEFVFVFGWDCAGREQTTDD